MRLVGPTHMPTGRTGIPATARGPRLCTRVKPQRTNRAASIFPERTGTFYGIAMTAGDIYTVAGAGRFGFSGDGGPATGAESATPDAVAAGGTGGLVAADLTTGRIRQVTG